MKHMVFSQINQKKRITTTLVMPHLKMEEVDKVALEASVDLVIQTFQIYLKTFLGTLEVAVEDVHAVEVQKTEVLI